MVKHPAFIKEYFLDGGTLFLHSGEPISAAVIESFMDELLADEIRAWNTTELEKPANERKINPLSVGRNAAFWVIEGYVVDYELDAEKHPSLHYYLSNRGDKDLKARWAFYLQTMEVSELNGVVLAYNKTRRHLLETEAELSLDEKKSA